MKIVCPNRMVRIVCPNRMSKSYGWCSSMQVRQAQNSAQVFLGQAAMENFFVSQKGSAPFPDDGGGADRAWRKSFQANLASALDLEWPQPTFRRPNRRPTLEERGAIIGPQVILAPSSQRLLLLLDAKCHSYGQVGFPPPPHIFWVF